MLFWIGSSNSDQKVCKVDFDTPNSISSADPDDANLEIPTTYALDIDQFISGGIDTSSTPNKHVFYSSNVSITAMNWTV